MNIPTLLFICLKRIVNKKDIRKLEFFLLWTSTSESDVEIKISHFLHVLVVQEPFKGSVNYCLGSAWVQWEEMYLICNTLCRLISAPFFLILQWDIDLVKWYHIGAVCCGIHHTVTSLVPWSYWKVELREFCHLVWQFIHRTVTTIFAVVHLYSSWDSFTFSNKMAFL